MQINKLQRIQNSAARLVTHAQKYDHITPILHELHWLPIKVRIQYRSTGADFPIGKIYTYAKKPEISAQNPIYVLKINGLPDKIKDAETIHSEFRLLPENWSHFHLTSLCIFHS